MEFKDTLEIEGKRIELGVQALASRANGEVLLTLGQTQVLATAVMANQEVPNLGFFPLSVYYEERYYAAGKILGSRYIKREGKPSDNAILISRLIDRTIRPLFSQDLQKEVQVIVTCLSWDETNDPDVLGILGASLALSLSDIPWQGPIAAIRVGLKNGGFILNPSYSEREEADLDIVFSGKKEKGEIVINMAEATGQEVKEELILEALKKAQPALQKIIEFQEKIIRKMGKAKIKIAEKVEPELAKEIQKLALPRIEGILFPKPGKVSDKEELEKTRSLNEFKEELVEELSQKYPTKETLIKEFFEQEVKNVVQNKAIKEGRRISNRGLQEIRELKAQVGLVTRAHGSGLFSRGITRSLSILTLGGPGEQQLIEGMEVIGKKRFLHHYNFPPYSTGEVKRLMAPSRREIGHGMLVEKALLPLIPDFDNFPYTIRIVSEILSSNGSTSMAAVCSSSLALFDAGVPLERPVAGVAMGLAKEGEDFRILTDIEGREDAYGYVDFKLAGTDRGTTALQMDVKLPGISSEIFAQTLWEAKRARLEILDFMRTILAQPRAQLSPFAPRVYRLQISPNKIGEVVGPKGQTIKAIIEKTGASIDIEPSGLVYISSLDEEMAKKALGLVKNISREIKVGEAFLGTVKRLVNFGAFLELTPGHEGLLHNSQSSQRLKLGQQIPVKVISVDELGRVNLAPKSSLERVFPRKQYGKTKGK